MYLINGVTSAARQIQTLILPNDKKLVMELSYKPMQTGWFVSLSYDGGVWEVKNVRIVTSPNILNQFQNLIPFGLGCFVEGGQEPLLQQDFLSARAKLYILDRTEVELFGDVLSGQVSA